MKRVALIFGGTSSEHEISCLGAASVAQAIDTDRYEIVGIGISKSGKWSGYSSAEIQQLEIVDGKLPVLPEDRLPVTFIPRETGPVVATVSGTQLIDEKPFDIVFPLLHGPYGEDGTIQGLCEIWGVPYVGTGVATSAIGMDKVLMKLVFQQAGLPILPYVFFHISDWETNKDHCLNQIASLNYPLYVKPARGGSSIGISRVDVADQLPAAIEAAAKWDPKVIVEQAILGAREIEFGVLGNPGEETRVSTPGEVVVATEEAFFDFENKYLGTSKTEFVPNTDIPNAIRARGVQMAKLAFEVINGTGLSRVDMFFKDGELWLNEINTMPGFTKRSTCPAMWRAVGYSYTELISEVIELGLRRGVGLR